MKPAATPATRSIEPSTLTVDSQLMQDYLQSAGILISQTAAPAVAPFQNVNGESEAVVIDVNGNLQHVCREPLSDSGWNMYGLGAGFRAIAPIDSATLWAIGLIDDAFWQNNQGRWTQFQIPLPCGVTAMQISAGTDGTVWALDDLGNAYAMGSSPMQTPPAISTKMAPVAIRNSSNLLHLFCIDQTGALWTIGQDMPTGGWGSWISLSTPSGISLTTLAAGSNQDGRLQVFAVGSDESLHTIWETAPNVWSNWDVLTPPTGTPLTSVAALQNSDGRLEVVALGKQDGAVYHLSQTAANNGWGSWSSFGAPPGIQGFPTTLAIASQAGRLSVFAGGTGTTPVSCITQTAPGTDWGSWTAVWHLTTPFNVQVEALAVVRNQDGRLEVFCLATTDRPGVWHGSQQTPNGNWGSWSVMGGLGADRANVALGVGQNADGRLEVFVSDSAGAVWHDWQESPGSSQWSGWGQLGTAGVVQIQGLTVLQDRSGRLSVLGMTASGVLWQIQQGTLNGAAGWGNWLSTWSAWSALNAPALKHPPTGIGNACWAIDNNGAVINWNGTQWNTVALPQSQPASWVSVGSDGTIWALDTNGVLYQYVNNAFQAMPGTLPGVAYFSASSAASLWATAANNPAAPQDYSLFQFNNGIWNSVHVPPLYGGWNPPQVSVGVYGSVCLLDGSGTVWRQAVSGWTPKKMSVSVQSIAAEGAATAAAWAVDANGTFWRNFGSRWVDGQPSLPNAATATQVSIGNDGTVWALDNAGNLYIKNGLSWSLLSASTFPQQPPSGSAGACWTIDHAGELLVSNGTEWNVVQLPENSTKADFVSVGTDGSVWVVVGGGSGGSPNTCYQYLSGRWQQAGGNFVQAPVGSADDLWCVTSADAVCRSADAGQTWSMDNTAPASIKQVAVGPDGSVWALDTTGTAWINPAWQRIMRPTGMAGWPGASQCASVTAGRDENGVRYVFFTGQKGALTYTVEVLPHTWIDPLPLAAQGISGLGLTNQQDTGELIAYGISGSSLLTAQKTDRSNPTSFAANSLSPSFGPGEKSFTSLSSIELSAVNASNWYWFSVLGAGVLPDYPAGVLSMAISYPPDNRVQFWPVGNTQTQAIPVGFTSLLRLPWLQSGQAPCAVVVDNNQQIEVVSVSPTVSGFQYSAGFLMLTGVGTWLPAGATAVAAVLQSDSGSPPQPRLYATAPITSGGTTNDALWMLQQIDSSIPVSQPAAWSPWIPLGGSYTFLATGPSLIDTESLFAVSSTDGSLHSISQNAVTGKWTDLELNRPSLAGNDIDAVSMYHTEITLSDQNRIPQADVPIMITAETPVTVWVENTLYVIDADQGVTWNTDVTGKIHVRALATDLHTPSLTFQADGLPSGTQSVYPPQHVHDFLAGTGQLAVGGGQPATFTVSTIQAQWPTVTQDNANKAVTYAGEIAAMPKNAASRAATVAGWAADLADPGHPRFHTFLTSKDLAAYRRQLDRRSEAGLPGSLGSWWDDVKHAAEDVVHAIKKGAMKVDKIVVDTTNNIVSLTLYIGDQLVGTFNLVVATVADAMHAIEAIMKTLIADIEEIIEWLMLLFEWEDIWATKETLEGFLRQAVSIGQGEIGALRTAAQGLFTSIKDTLSEDFDAMITTLQSGSFPYTKFADLPQWPSASTTLAGAALHRSALGSLPSPGSIVHSTWLLSKTLRSITPNLNFGPTASINLTDLVSAMNAQAIVADLKQAVTDFENYFMNVFKDPGQFAQLTIVAVLQEVKDLLFTLLDLLDGLAQVFLDVVEQMLGIMNGWFNQHLDIPVISPLYKFITGLLGTSESLTILHLFALLTAVPLTIIHKLIFNGQKPYDGIDVAGLRPSVGRAPAGASEPEAAKWNQAYLVTGSTYTGVVTLLDALIVAQRPADPPIPPTPPIRIATSFSRSLADILALVQRINCWPGMFPNLPHPENATAGWLLANWCIYWFPPMVDAAFNPTDVPEVRISCLIVLGIAASVSAAVAMDSLNDYIAAQTVIQPWPLILSFMMLEEVRILVIDSTDGLGDSAYLKLVADTLFNLGVTTLHYVGNLDNS